MTTWQTVAARVVQGYRVASGLNQDPRFPGGTLQMQAPYFLALGFDLRAFYIGTINVSISPLRYRLAMARHTFRKVKWHPTEAAEDFSFIDVGLARPVGPPLGGFIYYPHPETKPEHFQQPDVLELLLPFIDGLSTGAELILRIPAAQMVIESSNRQNENKSVERH
jgi:hypothetical protein